MDLTIWSVLLLVYFAITVVGVLVLAYFTIVGMAVSGAVGILSGQIEETAAKEQPAAAMTIEAGKPAAASLQAKRGEQKPLPVSGREVRKDQPAKEKDHVRV